MKLSRFISFPVFLISLAIGVFIVYITSPGKKSVYIYPTPENTDKFLWEDSTGTCFKWDVREVKKPKKNSKIKEIPIQN